MKKTANRIVSVAILVAFLFTNTAFAYPQNYSSLRPRPSSERADTLAEAIQKELVEIIYPSGKPLNLANLTGDDVVVVSMSAGEGTRFKSTIPKVIAPLAGKPLAQHNIDTARANGWKTVTVVVGHRKGEVIKALSGVDAFITQPDTKSGTANAAMQVAKVPGLLESSGLVLITGGDTCIKPDVMAELVKRHKAGNNAITMLTIDAPEKGGAGRIVRNPKTNAIDSIAERKDIEVLIAAGKPYRLKDGTELPAQQVLATREKNRSTYVISAKLLGQLLGPVTNDNAQRQFYLTDMIANAVARGMRVDALTVDSSASLDANTVEDLARAEQILASGWGATPPPSGTPSHRPEGAPSEDPLKREVEQAALQWFRPGATRADEIKLEEFLKAKGEKAIEYFVQLVETDRGGESIGTWRIPPTDFNNPRTKKLLEKFPPGSHICTSVENDDEGKPIPYYMPETLEGVMNWFEKERIKMMSRVAIQRALGRKMVVDVGVGVVGNIELTCGCANKIDMPAKQYAKSPRFRPPVSGKDQHNTFAIGYEPIGDGTYRQDMIDRGLVGVRAEDPEQLKAAREGHERGNLAGTFLPQVLSVCDVSLLSIPQHPFKTMHDHPENIYADPRGGLEVVEMVAEFMPPRAACIIESTVYPFYYSLFALPVFEEVMKKRNLPRQEQPQLCYSFQRMEPGPRGWRSNKQQIRMGGAATEEGLEALKQYFEMSNYKYSSSKKVVATELTKDSENAIRYQIIASSAPMQDMFEALGLDIYAETRRIAEAMVMQGISGKNEQAVIKEAIESMRNAYERAAEYAETQIPDKTARDTFTGQVRSVFNQSATAILTQAVLYPGGYCVIEQIGHLIYGMVATKLVTELDVKAIFDPALKTIAYMKMRQRELAGWVVSELADKGIEPQDTKIWGGGATYMPQIGDARNGSLELLMRYLADMGVTEFTVFDPYLDKWPQLKESPFSPESEGYSLVRQTWLKGVNYVYGKRVVKKAKISTENVEADIDPHTSISRDRDALILSMDHPQLVGRYQPPLRRTVRGPDGKPILHRGLSAPKVAARLMAHENKIILDTHYFLSDEDIKEFFALGFDVRALGRGNIGRLKEEAFRDNKFQLKVAHELLSELQALRSEAKGKDAELESAITTIQSKIEYLNASGRKNESDLKQKYEAAKETHSRVFGKQPKDKKAVLDKLVLAEVEPAANKLESRTAELTLLAEAIASQVEKGRCTSPTNPDDMYAHIRRLNYLNGLLQGFLGDCGLAANEMFVSDRPSQPQLPTVSPAAQSQAVATFTDNYLSASLNQFQGINSVFEDAAGVVGTNMHETARAIVTDRPFSHSPLSQLPGAVPDAKLAEASERSMQAFIDMEVGSGNLSPLEARARLFSHQANANNLRKGPQKAAWIVLMELARFGIAPDQARVFMPGQNKVVIGVLSKALTEIGCPEPDTAGPMNAGRNAVILTDSSKGMDVIEFAAAALGREGNLLFDANDALSDEQVKMLLALDWQVAGTGRNDIYGRDLQDIKGNMRRIPGLIDEVTPQNRLEAARQLLTKLQAMPDSAEAVKTVQAKIEYLSAMVELERSPKNLSLKQKLQILRKAYEGARRDQEKKYDVPLGARDTRRALDAAMKNVVSPLENTLTGLLRQAGEVSSALTKQLQEGAVRRPQTTQDLHKQLTRLAYMNYTCDDVLTDLARAGDTMFNEEGQTAARDELDRFKKEEKGSRLKLPQAFAPQDLPAKLQKQLRQASIPTGLVRSGKKFMAGERLAAVEDAKKARGESYRDYEAKPFTDKEREPIISTLSDQEATAYQQGRLWHRFTAAGDVKVLPALMMHPGADGKHIEVTQDPEGNLAFTSLRFRGDAKKGKKNNPAEWVKFTLLVPLYIVDVASPKPGEEGKRTFDYFITQQLLRSSIPWKTKQWLVNEVLGKGKILTTIRTDDAVAQNKLAVVMQGNPYADIGAEKEAGGSGRAGYLVSMESAAPEVIVTTDEYGRENLIEIKGVGPMFGERTPGKISQMERTIAGGVKIDKTGKKVSGQTAMRQLYGLVRGPQTGELVVNEGQPAHKEEGATSGVAAAVNHILPWSSNRADIVGQVWRTTPSSKREGSKFIGGKQDYDDAGIGYRLGRQAAEMLSHFGNSANVHIAPGCDNIRMAGVPTRRKTTVEGQSESVIVPNPGEKSYFTDEDSLVNTADERNPFEAFDYYFRWTLVFALTDYEDAKSGSLEKLNYPSIVEWMNGFIDRFLEAPIVRNNPKAVQRFEEIRQMLYSAKDAAAFKQTAELLHAELRDSYVAYRSLRLRLENGFNPTGDSPYTANTGKNFQRGRLTAKGPSRVVGAKGERKPSAEEEARAFIAAERKVLDLAQKAIEEGGYPPLKFDFGMARKELDEKEKMIGHIARQERLVINKFFQVMGWGSFTNRTGYFSQDNITREKQALKVSSDQEALESLINKAYEALMDIGAATPGLLILEDLPSYEQVYNLKKYYLPRAQLKHAKVFIEDTFRGGTAPARMGDGTVWATGLFDKQAAQKLGRTGMEMGKRRVAEVQEGEKIGLETFETKGVQGDMRALVKRNPRSRKVVIYHHGLAGIAADMAIARMNYEISDKASLVTFTSSRLRPLMPGEELNPEAMDRVFGQKGTPQAKTFQDEAEDLRRVVAGTIEYFRGCGVPEDEIEIVLVGKNLGAEAASQVARDFPQIETLMMVGSGLEAFSSSGLPKAQWHDLISRPERGTEEFGQIVANFRAFTGRTILVRALQDLPERQRSMQDLIPLAGGRVELHGVNDEHDMQNEASFAHLAKILSKTIGDDWRFAPGSQQPGTVRIIARDALNAFANWRSVPALRQQLETWYGTDEAMLDAQAKRYLRSITAAIERGFAAQDKEIIIMRVPGKVKTVGNACDYPKGFFDSAAMATMSDNIFVMSERNDDVVNLGTINSQKFPDKQYHLNDGDFGVPPSAEDRFNGQESWDKWIKKDAIKPLWPMKGKDKDSYWFSMVWAATAWGRGAEPAKRANFKGYNFFVGDSNLSSAGGLSSSSNIFIASILGLNYLYDLGWSLEQLATAGYAERYACGTQGGIADHAAILMCMAGQMGILSLSPKTTITGQVTLPKGLNMFIFDSRINREIIAPYVSPRTADYAGSNDPAALFKTSTSQMRAMGNLGSRLGFIYFKNALKNRGVNFNQLGAIVGNGLAAEAKIPNGIKEEEIRGILLSLPARISKQDLLKALQSMINENLLDADTLGVIRGVIETVNAIQFPKDGLALRGLVTYFISGAAKVNEYCKAANAKDIPKIIEVIRAYQNGERLVKFDPTGSTMTFFDGTPTDDQIKTLPLWQLAGIRERSLEPIDRLIDKMEGEVKGIALMVMGQGQGGQIIAYVPEAQVPAFKEALVRNMKEIVSEDLFLSLVKRGFTKQVIGYEDGPTHEYQKGLIDMLINDPAVAARLKALVNESAARPQALDEAVGIFKDNFSPAIEEYSQAGQGASVVMFPAKSQPAQQVQTAATAAAAAAAIGQLGDTVRQLAEAAANV